MAQLDCSAENCVYNKNKNCCKGDIMVGGKRAEKQDDTCCESFAVKRGDSYVSALEHPCQTISIDCEAVSCQYNKNYKCHADHVNIMGNGACEHQQTACGTFKK